MSLGRIGHYEVLERIGNGGMGVVFKAKDIDLDRIVALKVLPESTAQSEDARSRLRREARAEASLNHPNIATCYEISEAPAKPPGLLGRNGDDANSPVLYLAMEFVTGADLLSTVTERQCGLPEILNFAVQVLSGLEAAHDSGVIHRDLKPGNVFVSSDGRVKILDFGLAKMFMASAARTADLADGPSSEGHVMGTAAYMSPEQAMGENVDQRSDLFSFGVMLFQLITGHLPFSGATYLETLYARVRENPPAMKQYDPEIPAELERIVRKLLARKPSNRYQSASDARADIEELVASLGSGRALLTARRRSNFRFAAIVLGSGIFLSLLLIFILIANSGNGTSKEQLSHQNVAVLRFANLTGVDSLGYLADGISAGVLNGLVQYGNCNVVSQSVAWRYQGDHLNVSKISHELDVKTILEGAVRLHRDAVRVEVQLVNCRTGYVAWSDRFERPIDRVYELQDEVALRVAGFLSVPRRAQPARAAGLTRSAPAYDKYLQANQRLADPDDPRGPDAALALYKDALTLDPRFALAYAGQSRALWKIYSREKDPSLLRQAEASAEKAIALNPDLLESRLAHAQMLRGTGKFDDAIADLESVIRINPYWDEAYLQLAAVYRDRGDLDKAEQNYRHALSIRPEYWRNWNGLGGVLWLKGNLEEARKAFREVIRLNPDENIGYEQLAAVDLTEGRYEDALASYRRMSGPVEDATLASNIATAYFSTGALEKAGEFYRKAVSLEPHNQMCRQNLGDCYVREGRLAEAMTQYREALNITDQQLRESPKNIEYLVQRVVFLAKLGECAAAARAFEEIEPVVSPNDADRAHSLAKAYALCGESAKAVAALRRAILLGLSMDTIRHEDEFKSLENDPEFLALIPSSVRQEH